MAVNCKSASHYCAERTQRMGWVTGMYPFVEDLHELHLHLSQGLQDLRDFFIPPRLTKIAKTRSCRVDSSLSMQAMMTDNEVAVKLSNKCRGKEKGGF